MEQCMSVNVGIGHLIPTASVKHAACSNEWNKKMQTKQKLDRLLTWLMLPKWMHDLVWQQGEYSFLNEGESNA